ncbi:MAG: Crp/Fnr family transcriptional regulator [Pseudomonadota bacterium]
MDKSVLDKRVSFLKTVAPFKSLSTEDLGKFARCFQARSYRHRDIIIREGDRTSEFYVISAGKVRILTLNPTGDESCLRVLSSRDIFGELSACDRAPRSASVQALGNCTLLVMSHGAFLGFLRTLPDFSMAFIHFLLEKLRWTTLYSHTIAQYDTAGRLLHLLLHYKDMIGKETVPGKIYEVDLSLNQADLASMVGAKREWVNRLLQQWRKQGLLTYDRGKITLLDLPAVVAERDRRMAMLQESSWGEI